MGSRPQHWRATTWVVSNQHSGRQQCSSLFQSVPLRPWPLLVTPMPLLPLITLPLLLIIQLLPLITLLLLLITPLLLLLITQPLMLRRLPRTEARDGPTVKGQYRVELPDCRTQIVDYFVDEYKQYHADVKYEGEICPDKSLIHHKAPYAPAPAPYHAPAPAPYYAPAPAPYHAPVVHHPIAHAPLVHHPISHSPVVHHPLVHAPLVHAPVGLAHVSTPFVHHG